MLEVKDWRCEARNLTVPVRLLKKPRSCSTIHTGRDEVEIRYPVTYCFSWIPDSCFAPSGMTGSVNCDGVSKGIAGFCGLQCIGAILNFAIRNSKSEIRKVPSSLQSVLLNPVSHLVGGHTEETCRFQDVSLRAFEGFFKKAFDGFGVVQCSRREVYS